MLKNIHSSQVLLCERIYIKYRNIPLWKTVLSMYFSPTQKCDLESSEINKQIWRWVCCSQIAAAVWKKKQSNIHLYMLTVFISIGISPWKMSTRTLTHIIGLVMNKVLNCLTDRLLKQTRDSDICLGSFFTRYQQDT